MKFCSKISYENAAGNEVFTRHAMNYGQIRYPTLVVKFIKLTKAESLIGT
jgi:hypothetical protein